MTSPGMPDGPGTPDRGAVVTMLATFGDRAPDTVGERIGSLELTWLITKVEQQYDVSLDLSDDVLSRMTTIAGAVAELREALGGSGHA
jgi:hypothetical protein